MLRLKNGQFKDFTALLVAYEMINGKDALSSAILSASVVCGLQGMSQKEEREIIYNKDNEWGELVSFINSNQAQA